jgi:hypothetical protein
MLRDGGCMGVYLLIGRAFFYVLPSKVFHFVRNGIFRCLYGMFKQEDRNVTVLAKLTTPSHGINRVNGVRSEDPRLPLGTVENPGNPEWFLVRDAGFVNRSEMDFYDVIICNSFVFLDTNSATASNRFSASGQDRAQQVLVKIRSTLNERVVVLGQKICSVCSGVIKLSSKILQSSFVEARRCQFFERGMPLHQKIPVLNITYIIKRLFSISSHTLSQRVFQHWDLVSRMHAYLKFKHLFQATNKLVLYRKYG